ncbi:MAG: neutral/alkaline non-lysosomal ceramidase N-terminal domain-containing protein [Deltaproteobacteria bacterium]|nr:neutral/alkaline non-lysosomal ceramidase N-terminal domain-containing protein [Deltaproteobacteria bacterium]
MKTRKHMMALVLLALVALLPMACGGGDDDTDGGTDDGGGDCTTPCDYYYECSDTQDCLEGCCRSAAPCGQDVTCQPEGKCVDGRCVKLCVSDPDCPLENQCIHGFCEAYLTDALAAFSEPAAGSGGLGTTLQVGLGDVPLDFPMGVSMAGYGARLGPRTPYRKTLGGSESMWDRPRVKALVFEAGDKRIVLIRTATSWTTDWMLTHTAWRLYQATGENYINRIVLSANHTHSYPGRYSFWVPDVQMGVLGHGDYSPEMFERHTKAMADAVLIALDNMQAAKFAWAKVGNMDPEGLIHRDRREEDQDPMDDSLYVMRIDDINDQPLAFLFDLAMHGTISNGKTITGDAPGAVEIIAQQKLQELTGLPVMAVFLSGNSGDVTPEGGGNGLDDWRSIQQVGLLTWPILRAQFEALEGQARNDVTLDISNLRAPVDREALGYGEGQFRDEFDKEYYFGAFQCVGNGDEDPATHFEDGQLGCIFSMEMLTGGVPASPFCKTHLTTMRIGDLGFVTLPGEPLGKYGRDAAQLLLDADDRLSDVAVLGYSQDHHLYLMHADNWLQGGYAPSMGIWGWAEGDYYLEKLGELAQAFAAGGVDLIDNGILPAWYDYADDTVEPTTTTSEEVAEVLSDVPTTVERSQLVDFRWVGGHPGVDLPRMTLEREVSGNFEPVLNLAGTPYSDDGHSTMLTYELENSDYDPPHIWQLQWEEHLDFPLGTYRLHIEGHYFDGTGTQGYSLDSSPFELLPSTHMILHNLQLQQSGLTGSVSYAPGLTNDDGESTFEGLASSSFLHRSARVPPYLPHPVPADGSVSVQASLTPPSGSPVDLTAGTVDADGQVAYTYVNARDGEGTESTAQRNIPTGNFTLNHSQYEGAGHYSLQVQVTDAHGNSGTLAQGFDLQ